MEEPLYERVSLPDGNRDFPIRLFVRENDAGAEGCPFHWHEALEFYYVVSGGVYLNCGGRQEWLFPGDVGFVRWCVPHRGLAFQDGTKHYIVQFDLNMLRQETELSRQRSYASYLLESLQGAPVFLRQNEALARLFQRLVQEYQEQKPGYELCLKACLYEILALLLRMTPLPAAGREGGASEQSSLECVRGVLHYLSDSFAQPEAVRLPQVAARFGLSVPYLCRVFRRHTGRTVTGYVNELRCARAVPLLQSGLPLPEVAAQVGLRDANYFSRMFKHTTGKPPSACRLK